MLTSARAFRSAALLSLAITPVLFAAEVSEGGRLYVRGAGGWEEITRSGDTFEVDSRVITVRFHLGVTPTAQQALHEQLDGVVLRRARTGFVDVEIAPGQDPFDAIAAYRASGLVEVAEPNTFGVYHFVPNDPSYPSQWHLPQIFAEEAWDTTTGDPVAVIAVLDSGTEFTHEDLGVGGDAYQNVWLNVGEDAWSDADDPTTGNGVDDDLNGFADDWKGWDFHNGDNDSRGSFFHGTAVAGVVAAKTHNATGVAGVAGGSNSAGARVLIAGVGDAAPNGAILDDAILYAADMGAHVIQLSLSVGQSAAIDAALEEAYDNGGVLIVCSSGNGGGSSVAYPSSDDHVMSIGATTQSDLRASFSQFGTDLELAAPGVSILTLDLNDGYGASSGTSFASPIVSGVAALMLADDPSLTNVQVRQILRDTADKVGGYNYDWDPTRPGHSMELGYGRINAAEAVLNAEIFADGFESGDTSAWSMAVP